MPAVETTLFAAAWAAGIVEGASVLVKGANQDKEATELAAAVAAEPPSAEQQPSVALASVPQLIFPAVLYGTISLPLGLIGASPGPTTIGYLPFAPKMDGLYFRQQHHQQAQLLPPGMPPQVPLATPPKQPPKPRQPLRSATSTVNRTVAKPSVESNSEQQQQLTPKKGKRRVDLLREENRNRQKLRSAAPATAAPLPAPAAPPKVVARLSIKTATPMPGYFIATLDGQALPTPLAEAMRRTRFLLVGAGLATLALSYKKNNTKQLALPQDKKPAVLKQEAKQKQLPGKDAAAIQQLVANSQNGAVLRYCESLPEVVLASSTSGSSPPTKIATIPLYSKPTAATTSSPLFWNPGTRPEEWRRTPISSDWLMRTSSSSGSAKNLLVLEADVTPASSSCSIDNYFDPTNPTTKNSASNTMSTVTNSKNLSKAMLLFHSLIDTARAASVLKSPTEAVQVVLGCCGKPALPLPANVVYIDASIGLGVEVESVLERMHHQVQSELLAVKQEGDERRTEAKSARREERSVKAAAAPSNLSFSSVVDSENEIDDSKPSLAARVVYSTNTTIMTWIDTVGFSIRQAAAWTVDHVQDLQEDFTFWHRRSNARVVHVLSDQRPFVQFLQRSLHADWRIVWYDATKNSDVALYVENKENSKAGSISVVCCSTDDTTRAFLLGMTKDASEEKELLQRQRVLAVVVQKQQSDKCYNLDKTGTVIGIREVHDNLFCQVRDLLSEGKTVEEVQEIVDLIR